MFKILFCVALVWFHTSQIISGTEFQSDLFDDLDGPNFLREDEGQIYNDDEPDYDKNSAITKRVAADEYVTTNPSKRTKMFCKVTAHSTGIITKKWNANKPPIRIPIPPNICRPFPTFVELQKPTHDQYSPNVVILHRCLGGCIGSQQLLNCTVKRQEEVVIQVLKINDLKLVNITVYNHTACGCDCITRQSECDAKIHNFVQDQCKCECKQDKSSSCDSTKMSWKEKTCKCECNSAPKICDKSPNQEWNADLCECDCKQKVKDRCTRKGKALNKKTCECDCPTPRPRCSPGESFLKYNCTCVPNSVVTK